MIIYAPIKFMQIFDISNPLDIDTRMFGDFVNMPKYQIIESFCLLAILCSSAHHETLHEGINIVYKNLQFKKLFHITSHSFGVHLQPKPCSLQR